MMRAYRESTATRMARNVNAVSPLIAPEKTSEPGAFGILNGSPVRNDSSMTPCPSAT
jgi:hypothetical protein